MIFCGLAESSTAAQHKCHDEPSLSFNSLEIFEGAVVKDVISSIWLSVSHSSASRKSSSIFESNRVAMKSSTRHVSSRDILFDSDAIGCCTTHFVPKRMLIFTLALTI